MRYEFYQQNEVTMIKQNAKLNFWDNKGEHWSLCLYGLFSLTMELQGT